MNVKASLDILMSRLGNRTDPELRAKCLLEMTLAQEQLEQSETLPWFLCSEETSSATKLNDRRLRLPPDFLRESEEQALVQITPENTEKEIEKHGYDDLLEHYGAAIGAPEAYAIRGEYLMFFPIPDAEYPVRFSSYYARQTAPEDTSASENAWFKQVSDLIIAKAGVAVSGNHLKDDTLLALFVKYEAEAARRLFHIEVAREEANRERLMED